MNSEELLDSLARERKISMEYAKENPHENLFTYNDLKDFEALAVREHKKEMEKLQNKVEVLKHCLKTGEKPSDWLMKDFPESRFVGGKKNE